MKQQQRQVQCNPDEHMLSQLFELSGICFSWTHQREYTVDQSAGHYYYDDYHLMLQRGKQKASLGSISLAKKSFGPTQFDFLKELRCQLDKLYGNTDEFSRWNEIYLQKHGEPGTRTEFEKLVQRYVLCKKIVGDYWFPLLRLAIDDIPSLPNISCHEWEQIKRAKQANIENFLTSATFMQLVRLLLEAYHQGTLPRFIIFCDDNGSHLESELIAIHPELANQILKIPLLEACAHPRATNSHEVNLVEHRENYVDRQAASIAQILSRIGMCSPQTEELD